MTTGNDFKSYISFIDSKDENDINQTEDLVKLGRAVFDRRKELGISRKRLAKLCQVSKSTIKKLEQAEKWPNAQIVFTILFELELTFSMDPRSEEKKLPLHLECFLKRKKLRISRKELAHCCEVSKSTIKDFEKKGKIPDIETLLNIIRHLDSIFNIYLCSDKEKKSLILKSDF